MGKSEAVTITRELARAIQQKLTPFARVQNMIFEQYIASDIGTVFNDSLYELSPDLAYRIAQ
jgi:hypothetical protein